MAPSFDPKKVLRQISNHLLDDLFQVHGHELDVPWDDLKQTEVDEIFDAWQALPESDRRAIEIVMHDVCEMATEDGIRAIVEEGIRQDHRMLLSDIDGYESRYDKAVRFANPFRWLSHVPSRASRPSTNRWLATFRGPSRPGAPSDTPPPMRLIG